MSNQKSNPGAQGGARPAAAAGGFRLVGFPKEFERHVWEELDKRFYIILLVSWLFVFTIITILGSSDWEQKQLNEQIRQRYLQKFYQAEIVEPVIDQPQDETGVGIGEEPEQEAPKDERAKRDAGKTAETRGRSAKEIAQARRAAASQRSSARQKMEQAVAGVGVLGVLSAGGSGGSGSAVVDVLGDVSAGGAGNLENVLSNVGGLATASSAGARTRLGSRGGGRKTGSADISDLMTGVAVGGSKSIGRQGGINLSLDDARVSGKGSRSANRSGDAISTVINSHNDAIEHCYKREAKLNPNLKGDVQIEFIISWNGRVKNSRILRSSLRNKNVENCIKNRIRSWRFKPIDKREGDVTVRQKYIFS